MADAQLEVDLNWPDWPLSVQIAYLDKVGVNPQYAALQIAKALEAGAEEVEALGNDAADDFVPAAFVNLDPRWLLGFVWIAERRKQPGLRFGDLMDRTNYFELLGAFIDAVNDEPQPEEQADPKVEKTRARPSKSASRSVKSSAGDSLTSTS